MKFINPNPFTTRPEIDGTFGVVASTHWIATAVGMATLEKGGNAFDAAVATAFTLQVVEPHLNGPGGDVPVILHDARRGRTEVICGQGRAPAGATIAHYRSLGLDMVPGSGLLAACVPGMFESWMLLLRDYGTLRLADVLAPAIEYAGEGYPLVERASATIATVEKLFREHWPTSAAVYLPDGSVPEPGALFANPTLAQTYRRILREAESAGAGREAQIERARKTWSQGFVAAAIDSFCRAPAMDTSGTPHAGVLTGEDMARFRARVEPPLTFAYGRYTVCKAGPWSQGPVMLQQLAILQGFELDGLDPTGPDFIHLQVEAGKLAYADRESFYGDPDFVEVPMATLLSEASAPWSSCGATRASAPRSARSAPASRPSGGSARYAATPCISTSSTAPATWSRRRRPAAGCSPPRSFQSSDSVSARARRCSGSRRATPPRSRPANARAPRSRRRSLCATANPTSPGARRAAISRTSGRPSSSCATSMPE